MDLLTGRRTPLALRNLIAQPRRLATSLAGVVFAIALMFMQRGFQRALLDSTVEIVRKFDCDIVMVGKARYSMIVRERFGRDRLYVAAGVEGVAKVRPMFIENVATWKNATSGVLRPIRIIGFDPADCPLAIDDIRNHAAELLQADTALSDRRSKRVYGPLDDGTQSELAGRRLRIAGRFDLGTDFANNGNLAMSESNFAKYFPEPSGSGRRPSHVDVGLISVEAGVEVQSVVQRLTLRMPEDIRVFSKSEFIARERNFWERNTPIGYIFGFGTIMGVVVGIVISYQILYSDIVEHLKEFATLKALGYRNRALGRVVAEQSLLLAGMAFVPAWLLSAGLYKTIASATGLLLRMTVVDSFAIFVLSAVMCLLAGGLATRRLFSTDPAELF